MPPTIFAVPVAIIECQAKGCPGLYQSIHTQLTNCGTDDCTKQIHQIYYERMLKSQSRQVLSMWLMSSVLIHVKISMKSQSVHLIFIGGMMV